MKIILHLLSFIIFIPILHSQINLLDSIVETGEYNNGVEEYIMGNDTLNFEINNQSQLLFFNNDTILENKYSDISNNLIISVLNTTDSLVFLKVIDRKSLEVKISIIDRNGITVFNSNNLVRQKFSNDKLYFVTLENNIFNLLAFNFENRKVDTCLKNFNKQIYFIQHSPEDENYYTQYFSKDMSYIIEIDSSQIDTIFKSNSYCDSFIILDDILTIETNGEDTDCKLYKKDTIINFTSDIKDDIVAFEKLNGSYIALLTTDYKDKFVRVYKNLNNNTFFDEYENNINFKLPLFVNISDLEIKDSTIYLKFNGIFNEYETTYNIYTHSFSDSSFFTEYKNVRIINNIPCFYVESFNKNSKNILIEAYSDSKIHYFPYELSDVDSLLLKESDYCFPLFTGSIELGYGNYFKSLKDGNLITLNEYINLVNYIKNESPNKEISLYGGSYGALLALCTALNTPDKIEALYLLASGTDYLKYIDDNFDQKDFRPDDINKLKKLSPIHIINSKEYTSLPKLYLNSFEFDEVCNIADNIEFFNIYAKINSQSEHLIRKNFDHYAPSNDIEVKKTKKFLYSNMYKDMIRTNRSNNKWNILTKYCQFKH